MIGDDERAQSIQVGAVLLFGALIIALSAYQAFVVPQQNEKVEFTHNQEVQNQLADLRNALVSVPGDSTTQSVSVTLGTSYPERLVAMNPGPPSGALRTTGTTDPAVNFSIANATAVTESDEVADLWNGTRLNYSTGALAYRPNYNVYDNAPTTYYENSVLFNQFDSGEVTLTDQRLVDGNTISLVALNGSIDRTQQGSTSVDVEPLSASTTTVTVQNESLTEPLTLRIPTRISVDTWENDLLADEEHVADVYPAGDLPGSELQLVAIELDPRETYQLRLAKAGVGSATEGESRAYLTDVSGDGATVPAGGRTDVVVAVRDRFNNPVSGVTLEASTNDTAATLADTDETTGSNGRATFTVSAGDGVSASTPVAVNVSYAVTPAAVGAAFNESGLANVTATVYAGQGGGGDGSGSAHDYVVDWRDFGVVPGSAADPATECSAIPCPDSFDVASIANPPDPGKVVTYYVNNSTAATLSPTYGATNISGQHVTSLTVTGQTDVNLSASNTTGADTILLDTVFESTFEDGRGVWGPTGTFLGNDPETSTAYANRGQQSIRIAGGNDGGIVTQPTYDTGDAELVTVEYWARADGPGAGEDLVVEYLRAGGDPNADSDWVEIDRLEGDQPPGDGDFERRARIAADDATHLSFRLRFRQVAADDASDEWYVDDVIFRTYGPTATSGSGNDQPPTADAGGPYAVDEGSSTTLDGTGSTDDGSIQSYSWTITSGDGTLTNADTAQPGYDAPDDVSGDQTVLVELTVTDDSGQTDTESTSITVRDTSSPPSVTVQEPSGGEQLAGGSTFTVEWSASDPDGDLETDPIDIEYSSDGGSTWQTVVTDTANDGSYDWTVPSDNTTVAEIRVTATDQAGNRASDTSPDFTVDSDPPAVSSASLPGTPIDDSEANSNVQRTLTLTFDEVMDQAVDPTVAFANDGGSVTSLSGSWADATTYELTVEFSDADVDRTVDVDVSGAQDAAGNTVSPETPLSFVVDSQEPGDVNSVDVVPDYINASNENGITVTIGNPDTVYGDETAVVELTDSNGDTVTVTQTVTTGDGEETTISGIDVSSLADGTVTPTAYFEDDVGNEGGSVTNDQTQKDTVAPTISGVTLDNDGSGNLALSFDSDEALGDAAGDITVTVDGPSTTDIYTFDRTDFSESVSGGTYTYTLTVAQTYDDGDGTYTATVDDALDAAGNNGGENGAGTDLSDSYTYSSPDIQNGIRYEGGLTTTDSNSAVQFDISNVDSSFARIEALQVSVRNGVGDRIYNGNTREIEITGGDSPGYRNENNRNQALTADGTTISLDQNGVLSTSGGGQTATVFVGQFGTVQGQGNSFTEYDFSGLTKVSSSDDWDVRVVLELQNRGNVVYYFSES